MKNMILQQVTTASILTAHISIIDIRSYKMMVTGPEVPGSEVQAQAHTNCMQSP